MKEPPPESEDSTGGSRVYRSEPQRANHVLGPSVSGIAPPA